MASSERLDTNLYTDDGIDILFWKNVLLTITRII